MSLGRWKRSKIVEFDVEINGSGWYNYKYIIIRLEPAMENQTVTKIMNFKIAHPEVNSFRNIRYCSSNEYLDVLAEIKGNRYISSLMDEEYFPSSLEKMCKTEMNYTPHTDNSLRELIVWGSYLLESYADNINLYLRYKGLYEASLFNGQYNEAHKWLKKIQKEICVSLWGVQQTFLLYNIQAETEKIDDILSCVDEYMSNNLTVLLMHYCNKMTDSQISYENYLDLVNNILSGADDTNAVWKYFDHKFSIEKKKNIHGIKIALVLDEQISLIDYYETYIDSILLLSEKEKNRSLIENVLDKLYGKIQDYRVKCIHTAFVSVENIIVDEGVCEVLEEYTRGNYENLKMIWECQKKKFLSDYTICNIFVKAGVNVTKDAVFMSDFWSEMQRIYTLKHDISISTSKVCESYKILYNTSWRYKLQSVLARKFKINFGENVLNLSVLNDKYFTPLFHQCIQDINKKIDYINQFSICAPTTYQLQKYALTGKANSDSLRDVEKNRRIYYEVKRNFECKNYSVCVELIDSIGNHDKMSSYERERIDRVLFESYLYLGDYVKAMQLCVTTYMYNELHISRMNISKLVEVIEDTEDENIKSTVCRSIILSLFYDGKTENVISSYLDYLESCGCNTIIEYINGISDLDDYNTFFLYRVCTTKLLLKDYVSKTLTNGSAIELRANILKKLILEGTGNKQRFISELNTIYKEQQLKTRMDSFNHTRIFIDRENLISYLKEEVAKEFAKYNAVQEIRSLTKGSKVRIANFELLRENYWDQTKFFYEIVDKIKDAYLSESPYSLEHFLSTRIRHNFCNDKLKKVFEEQNLFSKKEMDSSQDYNVNTYWQDKMPPSEYELLRPELSKFSRDIDAKIQEIKAEWIRIKKEQNKEGMFDYIDFTYNFVNYVELDFEALLKDSTEFLRGVISALDIYTEKILACIKHRISTELRPYYYERIIELETGIKTLYISQNYKAELLRSIEISKAKYIEDIESFQDIFNMENENYMDYSFNELIDFCVKIEADMNKDFSNAELVVENKCHQRFKGSTFPYLVDIMSILLRNAVEHSEIKDMKRLKIHINIDRLPQFEILAQKKESFKAYIDIENAVVINICNNLDLSVNEDENYSKIEKIIKNINDDTYKPHSNKEGGSGIYKIARTVDYNLKTKAVVFGNRKKGWFDIYLIVDLRNYEVDT